jgi:hypothetical protein
MVAEARDKTTEVIEHFKCECGHQWQREMYDGLVAVGCPACKAEHLTTLGRMFLPLCDVTAEG